MSGIKKIAIFGNNGMLGHDLSAEFMGNYDVMGYDINDVDITCREDVLKATGKYLPEVVINCAAYTDVDGCESNVQKAFSVNSDGCLFLAQACKEHNVKMIYISTDYVFKGEKRSLCGG